MSNPFVGYIVSNISLPIDASFEEAFSVAIRTLKRHSIRCELKDCRIFKKSVDARKRDSVKFVYSVLVKSRDTLSDPSRLSGTNVSLYSYTEPSYTMGNEVLSGSVVIVGSGPAGLFSGLMLAEAGYKPIILERGGSVDDRKHTIEKFKLSRILDPDTNIQFGAGGAGTFSDGKLVTRINDPMSSYILEKLISFGAPEDIAYMAKPHIGTDILSVVIQRVIDKIVEYGGEIRYHTKFLDFESLSDRVTLVKTSRGDIKCGALILAIGHSARDTHRTLIDKGLSVTAKSFSVGMRIEHPRSVIEEGLFGDLAGHPAIGHAEYNLSYNTKVRGVYTFCMCPGGIVVPAASEEGGVVVNGMSYHSRDGVNSNSAVCCTVFKDDYGDNPLHAIEFQRNIERLAFKAGGSDYSAPVITVGDFLNDRCEKEPYLVAPTYMDGGVKVASPKEYLPEFVHSGIAAGIRSFDNRIKGFSMDGAVLTGAETRTSSPVRIERDNITRLALGFSNLYPCGEGAGYAGGITSSAIDGIKTAISLISRFRSIK